MHQKRRREFLDILSGLVFGVCVAAAAVAVPPGGAAAAEDDEITVFKSPYCGCCGKWVDHMRAAGFAVTVRDVEDLSPIKSMAGVPGDLESCHTATVQGYIIEGHVPAAAVRKLLRGDRQLRGLAVPGMPVGSPGMEGGTPESYSVYGFDGQGGREVFMSVPAR